MTKTPKLRSASVYREFFLFLSSLQSPIKKKKKKTNISLLLQTSEAMDSTSDADDGEW